MKTLLETVMKLMGKESIGLRYEADRPADVPRLWVDASRFQALTGFKAGQTFEEGLQETIAYYEDLVKEKNLLEEIAEKNWIK